MADDHRDFRAAAERKYALALYKYETAEQATETIVGLKALEEADKRIQAQKAKAKAEMERIVGSMKRLLGADYTPDHIQPLHRVPRKQKYGLVAITAYKLMRELKQPMGSWPMAKLVAARIGMEAPTVKDLRRIATGIIGDFDRRVKAGQMRLVSTKPKAWEIVPLSERRASAASSRATD